MCEGVAVDMETTAITGFHYRNSNIVKVETSKSINIHPTRKISKVGSHYNVLLNFKFLP